MYGHISQSVHLGNLETAFIRVPFSSPIPPGCSNYRWQGTSICSARRHQESISGFGVEPQVSDLLSCVSTAEGRGGETGAREVQ